MLEVGDLGYFDFGRSHQPNVTQVADQHEREIQEFIEQAHEGKRDRNNSHFIVGLEMTHCFPCGTMRVARIKFTENTSVFHIISRCRGGDRLLDDEEKEMLRNQLERTANFCSSLRPTQR